MRTLYLCLIFLVWLASNAFAQWFPLHTGTTENLYALHFNSRQSGLACGSAGRLLKTTDKGQSWVQIFLPMKSTLFSIFSTNQNTFVVGDSGIILRGNNDFTNWSVIPCPTSLSLHSIFFSDNLNGWIAGDSGSVLKTADGGQDWQTLQTNSSKILNSIFFRDINRGFVVGDSGVMLQTTDGGMNWQNIFTGTSCNLHALAFHGPLQGIAVGDSGCVLRTVDGGQTWTKSTMPSKFNLYSVVLLDSLHFRISGGLNNQGFVLKSNDGGQSWSQTASSLFNPLYSIFFYDDYLGLIAGENGKCFISETGGLNAVSKPLLETPQNNKIIESLQVSLMWNSVADAESYYIQVADDEEFGHITTQDSLTGQTLLLSNLQHATTYYWRVRAINFLGASPWSSIRHFSTYDYGPQLLAPLNGQDSTLLPAKIIWQKIAGAEKYWLQIAPDSLFQYPVVDEPSLEEASFSGKQLNFRQQYFWRVKSKKDGHFSDWSRIYSFTTSSGLNGWIKQWSGTNSTLNDVFFINQETGWAVGYHGTLLKTTNGGAHWEALHIGTLNNLESVFFLNDTLGWITGWSGTILKTTDGGKNWISEASNTSRILRDICFSDKKNGWIVGEQGYILKTENGGETWTINSNITNNEYFQVHFCSPDSGWIAGTNWNGAQYNSLILRTYDGGAIWRAQDFTTIDFLSSLSFISRKEGWAAGSQGSILHTIDGGASWTIQNTNANFNLYSLHFIDSKKGWAVGNNGICFHSEDGGKSWVTQATGTSISLRSVHFEESGQGWAAGNYGTILQTSSSGFNLVPKVQYPADHAVALSLRPALCWNQPPLVDHFHLQVAPDSSFLKNIYDNSAQNDTLQIVGPLQENKVYYWRVRNVYQNQFSAWSPTYSFETGGTWVKQNSPSTANLNDIFFCNIRQGFVAGDSGLILKTNNGGLDWRQISAPGKSNLQSVFFTDQQNGWAVGDSGKILKTTNAGENWEIISVATHLPLKAVYFTSADTGWVVGGGYDSGNKQTYSVILKTTDSGQSWFVQMRDDPAYLSDVFFFNSTKGWAVGDGGEKKVLTTEDGGQTWSSIKINADIFVNKIYFQSAQSGYLGGTSGKLYHTSDGGQSWFELAFPSEQAVNDFYFSPEGQAIVLANGIFSSSDSGSTWNVNFLNGSENFNALTFASDQIGWVVGSKGLILKTSTAGFPVNIAKKKNDSLPKKFKLFQNYPNPFNPKTEITYQLAKLSKVNLSVYNIIGQKIKTLVDERQQAGTHTILFDGNGLASGVYIYCLKTNNGFNLYKKCILIK